MAPLGFWLQMNEGVDLRRTVLLVAVGTLAMAVLLPCLALVRDTTAHDWYAARKLTLTEAMLAVGFDPYKATVYRTLDGATMRINRFALVVYGEPIRARTHIFKTAGDHAVLGAIAGAIGAALCAVVFVGLRWSRRQRSGVPAAHRGTWTPFGDIAGVSRGDGSRTGLLVVSPAQIEGRMEVYGPVEIRGPLPVGRIVHDGVGFDENTARAVQRADDPAVRAPPALPAARALGAAAQSESATPEAGAAPGSTGKVQPRAGRGPRDESRKAATTAAVPVREPPERQPNSRVKRPTGPEPDGARRSEKSPGKTGARPTARRARRKRDYGRWI